MRSAGSEVSPGHQHNSEKRVVDKGFSMNLALELILKDEKELNRPTGKGQQGPFADSQVV